MKKILFVILSLLFISCKEEIPTEENDIDKRQKISFKEKINLNVLYYSDIEIDKESWKVMNKDFIDLYPDVNLKLNAIYSTEDYHNIVKNTARINKLADIIYTWPGEKSKFLIENGLLEDLKPLLVRDNIINNYISATVKDQGADGEIFELPLTLTTSHILYIDTVKLNKLDGFIPNSLSEFEYLTEKIGFSPVVMSNKDSWVLNSCLISLLLGRLAGHNWVKEIIDSDLDFNIIEIRRLFDTVDRIFKNNIISQDSFNLPYTDSVKEFINGDSPFLIDGDWKIMEIITSLKDDEERRNGIEFRAFVDVENQKNMDSTSIIAGAGLGIKAGLDEYKKEIAWSFIKNFIGKKLSINRMLDFGYTPSYILNPSDIDELNVDILIKKKLDYLNKYESSSVIDNYLPTEINDVFNEAIREVAKGNISTDKAISMVNKSLKKYREENTILYYEG